MKTQIKTFLACGFYVFAMFGAAMAGLRRSSVACQRAPFADPFDTFRLTLRTGAQASR